MTENIIIVLLIGFTLVIMWKFIVHNFKQKYRTEIGYKTNCKGGCHYIYAYQGKWELSNFFLVKIGRTNNMKQRMDAARTSNPFGIKLITCCLVKSDVYAETFIHKKFSKYRINKNNEWFLLAPQIWFYLYCINDNKLKDRYK